MASKENQEALKHIKDINWFAPKINYKGEQYILYDFYKKDFNTLQQAINRLEIVEKALNEASNIISKDSSRDERSFHCISVEDVKDYFLAKAREELENGK